MTPQRKVGGLNVYVLPSKQDLATAAAAKAAQIIRAAVDRRGRARVIGATGNSQIAFIDALTALPGIPWHNVELFHMDEYIGIDENHPASFRKWIRERIAGRVHPAAAHYLDGTARDIEGECRRYAALLLAAPIDVAFVGIGENGHIAFNDPHTADFLDPEAVKPVALDEACRRQQVGEGHFPNIRAVPEGALTLTCPALMQAAHLVCCAPDARKAAAVRNALEGPVHTSCPASLLRTHSAAFLYLDPESASLLSSRTDPTGKLAR